ncbi:MAG: DNA recombination/repair protein RecA, partial [Papillibacter sp.]|nr:DNA recombination/repair protein RecA [Papillibacter sp.]
LKFYASVRLDVRKGDVLQSGSEKIGNRTKVKVTKNKVAPPFREAEFDIIYGEGISRVGEIIDLGVNRGLIEKGGSWFTIKEQRLQGKDNVKAFLKANPEIAAELEAEIMKNSFKLMSPQSKIAAVAAGRAVNVEADDFED